MPDDEKRLWLLSRGEYSDYNVLGVFDDKHKQEAERIDELIDGNGIEQYLILNKFDIDEPPKGMEYFSFTMCRDGFVVEEWNVSLLDGDGKKQQSYYQLTTKERHRHLKESHWRMEVNIYASNKEHAVKVANEKRVQLLANGNKPWNGDI